MFWQHLDDLGDRSVSRGACQGLWEPGEENWTWLDLHHAGMVNLGGDKTLSECHNVD